VAVAQYSSKEDGGPGVPEPPTISVFDLTTNKRVKTLHYPIMVAKEYISLAFTTDGQNLASLTGAPEFNLVFWNWEKSQLLCQTRTTGGQGPVYEVNKSNI